MVRTGISRIQAADNALYRSKLGRLDVVSTEEAGSVCSGLDELFRHCRILSAHPGARPLGEASNSDVLLETVAHMSNERPESAEAWSAAEGCYFGGDESQKLLACVKDLRDAAWHDESVAEEARCHF